MAELSTQIARSSIVGGESTREGTRPFIIDAKALPGADQGFPIPIISGRDSATGIHIVPVFNFSSVTVTQKQSK